MKSKFYRFAVITAMLTVWYGAGVLWAWVRLFRGRVHG